MDEFELFKQRESDYSSEFERLAKGYLNSLNHLKPSPSDTGKNPYLTGYFELTDSASESIKAFLEEDNLRKDYPEAFKEMREKYHQLYLELSKSPSTDFNDGKYRAARDLYLGLNEVIQNAAGYDLKQLQNHQQQRTSVRR